MRFRRSGTTDRIGLVRTARIDRRVDQVVARANPGDIAVIDVIDLDRGTADQLVSAGVSAVVNASATCSGRFPVHGAQTLLDAGVLLVDDVGGEVFSKVRDGDTVRLDGPSVYAAGEHVVDGEVQSGETVAAAEERARAGLHERVGALVADAAHRLDRESADVVDGDRFPAMTTGFAAAVVAVVGAAATPDELKAVRTLVRGRRALVVGVGAGADRAREAKLRPALVVLGRGSVPSGGVDGAREVLVLDGADLDTRVPPGTPRVHASSFGSPEDTAVLLAHQRGAALVVTAGVDESLGGVLDRAVVAGSAPVVTRLRGGGRDLAAAAAASLPIRRRRGLRGLGRIVLVLTLLAGAAVGGAALERQRSENASAEAAADAAAAARAESAQARAFEATVAPALVADRLAGRAVAVVVLPGAKGVAASVKTLQDAGAAVSGPFALTSRYLDPARARVLRDLAVTVAAPAVRSAVEAQPDATPAEVQLDEVLASTLLASRVTTVGAADAATGTLVKGLAELGAVDAPGSGAATAKADLVVVLAPANGDASSLDRAAALVAALARHGKAVVIARTAPTSAADAETPGLVGGLRAGEPVPTLATVDDGASVTGRVATVLALSSLLAGGHGGAYGSAADATAPLPGDVVAAPSPIGTASQG